MKTRLNKKVLKGVLALESGINKSAGTIWVVGLQAYCVHTQQIFVKL